LAKHRILLVDDEAAVRFGIRDFLESHRFEVEEAVDAMTGVRAFNSFQPDVVLLDYMLPDGNALDLLPRLKEIRCDVPVIILTGHGSIDLAVRAIKEGAEQFVTKPVELPALLVMLKRLLDARRTQQRELAGQRRETRCEIDPFIGDSPAIRELQEQARRVAGADSPVLIRGETGTGKSVLARWLHNNSPRAPEPFVDLNCASLSRELLESELFGHEKGAFTGAVSNKSGLLEIAHRGTVFLDEIGDMDPAIQPKLLTVIEEKRFRRVGQVRDRQVDIRLIAATHQDLGQLVRDKTFRSDLYFRISTIPLTVPPLRERGQDIALLARHLLDQLCCDLGRGTTGIAPEAEQALKNYPWPGNIRELRNVLERAVLLSSDTTLRPQHLRFDPLNGSEPAAGADATLEEVERRHIESVLQQLGGRVEAAAARLGIPRSSLYSRIKRYGITPHPSDSHS
jgi:DNA-binding NtrC family response regulator